MLDNVRRPDVVVELRDQLDDPVVLLSQMKDKAGLPLDYWSDSIWFYTYTTESFPASGANA